jgi:hypothetical protein
MLQAPTPKTPQTFNLHPNIRARSSAPNPINIRSGQVDFQSPHYLPIKLGFWRLRSFRRIFCAIGAGISHWLTMGETDEALNMTN